MLGIHFGANASLLSGALPYTRIATGGKFTALPANLRHSIALNLYNTTLDRALDSPALTHAISLPKLNSHRLGVTYQPATAADAQLIESYKTQGATSLPLYLIQVKPLIQIDGTTVATGSPIGMGQDQYWDVTLTDPADPSSYSHTFEVTAGDEMVFGINGNGVTPEVVKQRFDSVPSNTAAENLYQIALHYWMEFDLLNSFAAKAYHVIAQRLSSIGLFATPLKVSYFFGIPRTGYYQSRLMDVSRSLIAAAGSSPESVLQFQLQSGKQGSYLEGAVFEQLFNRYQGAGVSAIQILIDASDQGIPVYTVNQGNLNIVLPRLNIASEIKSEIANAINAGKIAIVPAENPIHSNWTGLGYIIQDPQTGAGAYLIKGGLNGGEDIDCEQNVEPLARAIHDIVLTIVILVLLDLIIATLPEAVATPAILQALMVGVGLMALTWGATASAGTPSEKECNCEKAKIDARRKYIDVTDRIRVYETSPTPDARHYKTIGQRQTNLKDTIRQVKLYCNPLPSELAEWERAANLIVPIRH